MQKILVCKCMWETSEDTECRGQTHAQHVAQSYYRCILELGHIQCERYSRVNKGNLKESKGRREVGTITRNQPLACWVQGGHGCGYSNFGEVVMQRNKWKNHLQLNTSRQLRAAVSYVYSATSTAHESRYSLKSYRGNVLHMYEVDMQSALMVIFVKGMKRRIPKDPDWNKPVNLLVVDYILNHIEHEWVIPGTETVRKR